MKNQTQGPALWSGLRVGRGQGDFRHVSGGIITGIGTALWRLPSRCRAEGRRGAEAQNDDGYRGDQTGLA